MTTEHEAQQRVLFAAKVIDAWEAVDTPTELIRDSLGLLDGEIDMPERLQAEHPELEATIKPLLIRYLRLHTILWNLAHGG